LSYTRQQKTLYIFIMAISRTNYKRLKVRKAITSNHSLNKQFNY